MIIDNELAIVFNYTTNLPTVQTIEGCYGGTSRVNVREEIISDDRLFITHEDAKRADILEAVKRTALIYTQSEEAYNQLRAKGYNATGTMKAFKAHSGPKLNLDPKLHDWVLLYLLMSGDKLAKEVKVELVSDTYTTFVRALKEGATARVPFTIAKSESQYIKDYLEV